MRIRTIKPEWLDDERLVLASSEARVLSIALILLADDYGNGRANFILLASRVFPGKVPETLANALGELAKARFVVLYERDHQKYFHIRNWERHQKVDKPGKPQVPRPTEEDLEDRVVTTPEKIRETPANPPETLATDQDQDQDQEGKGRNRKGATRRPSRLDIALSDERVRRIADEYRRLHKKSDKSWKLEAKEDHRYRAVIILDVLEGANGHDELSESDIIAAIRGNKSDAWHAKIKKHELSYILRNDNVAGFVEKGLLGPLADAQRRIATHEEHRAQVEAIAGQGADHAVISRF